MARIPQDYHLHSHHSFDSQQSIDDVCRRALELGINEIAITDHADFVPEDKSTGYYQPDRYFEELERCRDAYAGQLVLRSGVEIGEPHRYPSETQDLLSRHPYDFVIGSLHWVGDEPILSNEYFNGKTVEQAYQAYFTELLEMVKVADFDILGHVDVGKRYGFDVFGFYDVSPFEEELREIYRVLIERNKGIEINHGSLRRAVNEPAPNSIALAWYRDMGGEVLTLGSDGHRANGVGLCLAEAVSMAKAAGFSQLAGYERRERFNLQLP